MAQDFFFYHFFSVLRTAFNYFLGWVCWQHLLLAFLCLRVSWFPSHFRRIRSPALALKVCSSFLSTLELSYATSFWFPWFLVPNPLTPNCFSPVGKVFWLSLLLQRCSLCLVFNCLIVMCLSMGFFEFIQIGICSASWTCRLLVFFFVCLFLGVFFLPNLGNFQWLFLENFFCFFFSWDSDDTNLRSFW